MIPAFLQNFHHLSISSSGSKKRAFEEDEIMEKAINCFEKATNEKVNHGFDIFWRHIASELEAIPYPHLQRWAKLQIQQIIFTAQSRHILHRKST